MRSKRCQPRNIDVVRGDVALRLAARCGEQAGIAVKGAVGQELQGRERVGGPTLVAGSALSLMGHSYSRVAPPSNYA